MTFPVIYRKSMRNFGIAIGIVAAGALILQLIGVLLQAFSGGGVEMASFFDGFFDTLLPAAYIIWTVLYLCSSYRDYKLGMQNGQTRRRIWVSELASLVTTSVLIWLLQLIMTLVRSHGNLAAYYHMDSFAAGLGSNMNQLLWMFMWITMIFAIGGGFALLPRKWKIVVAIALPTLFIFLMVQLAQMLVHLNPSRATLNTLANIFNWQGTAYIAAFIFIIIMVALSYLFTMRMQLRRD